MNPAEEDDREEYSTVQIRIGSLHLALKVGKDDEERLEKSRKIVEHYIENLQKEHPKLKIDKLLLLTCLFLGDMLEKKSIEQQKESDSKTHDDMHLFDKFNKQLMRAKNYIDDHLHK